MVPIIACLVVVVFLGWIEGSLIACEVPRAFDLGWPAVVIRRPIQATARVAVGTRRCTRRVVYRVLSENRVIFVSQDPLYRNPAGPLRGSITSGAGEARVVGRTTLAFFYSKCFFLAGVAWLWWPHVSHDAGSLAAFGIVLTLVALALFVIVGALEMRQARAEFLVDLAEVEAALRE